MGADFSRELEAAVKQEREQEQRVRTQSEPQQQQQLRPQPLPQPQQQQQLRTQSRSLSREQSSRDAWLLPDQGEVKPSKSSTRAVENTKPSGSQSLTPVKPLKELNFPHNYEDILKDADSRLDNKSSREKLFDQLYDGVFLNHKTKKYWVDKKSNGNCFMLYARSLSITWGETPEYWKWVPQKEASGTMTEVAELKNVCWLEVRGKFDTRKLSPGILYEVSFIVKLKDPAQGWEIPVNVKLVLPGGKKQQRKENLMEKLRVSWIEIPVGEFVASEQDVGEMEFSMYEYEGGMWKQGLVIKGVAIKTKNQDTGNYELPL